MAKLSDDLILRIISRLPPKFAVRCKILSKNYNEIISTANPTVFHCPAVNSRSFTRIDPLVGSDPISTALPIGISILASCNGVLLARIDCYNEYRSTSFERKVGRYKIVEKVQETHHRVSTSLETKVGRCKIVERVQEKHDSVSSIGAAGKFEKHGSRGMGPGNRENQDEDYGTNEDEDNGTNGTSTSNGGGGDGGGGEDNDGIEVLLDKIMSNRDLHPRIFAHLSMEEIVRSQLVSKSWKEAAQVYIKVIRKDNSWMGSARMPFRHIVAARWENSPTIVTKTNHGVDSWYYDLYGYLEYNKIRKEYREVGLQIAAKLKTGESVADVLSDRTRCCEVGKEFKEYAVRFTELREWEEPHKWSKECITRSIEYGLYASSKKFGYDVERLDVVEN